MGKSRFGFFTDVSLTGHIRLVSFLGVGLAILTTPDAKKSTKMLIGNARMMRSQGQNAYDAASEKWSKRADLSELTTALKTHNVDKGLKDQSYAMCSYRDAVFAKNELGKRDMTVWQRHILQEITKEFA